MSRRRDPIPKLDRELAKRAKAALGGPAKLAKMFEVSKQAASEWGRVRRIPRHLRAKLEEVTRQPRLAASNAEPPWQALQSLIIGTDLSRRYRGGKALHRKIRAAIGGGPTAILSTLNALYAADHSGIGSVLRATRPGGIDGQSSRSQSAAAQVEVIPYLVAFHGMTHLIGEITERGLQASDASRSVAVTIFSLLAFRNELSRDRLLASDELRFRQSSRNIKKRTELLGLEVNVFIPIDILDQKLPPDSKLDEELTHPDPTTAAQISANIDLLTIRSRDTLSTIRRNCLLAADLVLAFWRTDANFLLRVRQCAYERCSEPFFADKASSKHSRFCSPAHRQANHRARHA
jgi:hypothetical protein